MKKWILIAFLFLKGFNLIAQQKPWYSQYILNDFILNPALAGIENYWDIKGSYRNQWLGLSGAPVTMYITAQGPLGNTEIENETSTTVHPNFNPRGYDYWRNYSVSPSHGGIGFTVINDLAGPIRNFSAKLTYAYHIKLSSGTAISLGISGGIQEVSLNSQNLYFGIQYPIDPSVYGNGNLNKIKPDLDAGLWYYSGKYFLGISAQELIPQSLYFGGQNSALSTLSQGQLIPHIFLQGGYKVYLNEDLYLLPSMTLKLISPNPLGIDFNLKAQYHDYLWFGGSVRNQQEYALMAGFNTNNGLNIGYSYDFGTSPLYTVNKGTHEILIGILLRNRLKDRCPRNLW